MFYINIDRQPFFDPSPEVIELHSLIAIDEEEFQAIVDELNKPVIDTTKTITILTTENTITNTNGFVMTASPVIELYADGSVIPVTEEARQANITADKVSNGRYVIKGVLGTHEDEKWAIEVPTDLNGQPLVWVNYKVVGITPEEQDINGDGSYIAEIGDIVLDTYHRVYHHNENKTPKDLNINNNLWQLEDGSYKRIHSLPEGIVGRLVEDWEDADIPQGKGQFLSIRVNVPSK